MSQIAPSISGGGEVTAALGTWLAELQPDDIPDKVFKHIKLCILDAIGCGLYGAAQPWGRITAEVATELSPQGRANLFGVERTASMADVALANGTAVHGFEIDDVHVSSSYHPGAVTLPVCLAVASEQRPNGRAFLTAMIAGYEIGLRLGVCAGTTHSTSGYHVTGTVGSVGGAAAAAKLLGLDAGGATNALGIGATQAAGLYAARIGAMAKRFHAGRAAQSGVIAGLLARRGFTGSRDALEAPFGGFLTTLNGQHPAETMLEDLGVRWETLQVGFKVYASCASSHTTVDALHQLMRQGLTPENLARLEIRMSRKGAKNVGWAYTPREVVSAQMNGFYVAAVTLIDGETFVDQFQEDRLADPRIMALIERIEILHDPELDAGGAAKRHAVHVEAELLDGRRLKTFVEQRRGSAQHPLSQEEIVDKFVSLVKRTPVGDRAEEIVGLVMDLEKSPDILPLLQAVA